MSLVIIGLLPYIYEMATIVAGPCIFMVLLQYRDFILSFPLWQVVLAFGVVISVVLAIGNVTCLIVAHSIANSVMWVGNDVQYWGSAFLEALPRNNTWANMSWPKKLDEVSC